MVSLPIVRSQETEDRRRQAGDGRQETAGRDEYGATMTVEERRQDEDKLCKKGCTVKVVRKCREDARVWALKKRKGKERNGKEWKGMERNEREDMKMYSMHTVHELWIQF